MSSNTNTFDTNNKDFIQWFAWFKRTYPNSTLSQDRAFMAYNEHYFCNCESCTYRKERGFIPTKQHPDCTLPLGHGDLQYVPDNYGLESETSTAPTHGT